MLFLPSIGLNFVPSIVVKGLCHGFLASLKSQNIPLFRRKPTNNGLFLLTIAILVH